MLEFTTDHPFFEEALQFQLNAMGLLNALCLKSSHGIIEQLVGVITKLIDGESISGNHTVDQPAVSWIELGGMTEDRCVALINCREAFEAIANGQTPQRVCFEFREKRKLDPGKGEWHQDNIGILNFLVQVLLGAAYENQKTAIERKYSGRGYRHWDPEVQLLRHLRNGCNHGNRFNIRGNNGRPAIDPSKPPSWKNLVIPNSQALQGSEVVPDFFKPQLLIPFLYDIGNIISQGGGGKDGH